MGASWNGPGDWKYCVYADDDRKTVYFNTAGENVSPIPNNADYASLCVLKDFFESNIRFRSKTFSEK